MTLKQAPLPLLAGFAVVLATSLRADTLITYTEFEDQNEELVTTPTTVAEGFSGSEIALNNGDNLTTGSFNETEWSSPLPYLQGVGGWDAADSASAKAFTFTLEADEGSSFGLTALRFEDRATGAGPSTMGVWINDVPVFSRDVADSETELNEIALSGTGLDNLATAEFVIAAWDNGSRSTSGGGHWRTAGYEVEGAVSAIPEPSTWALLSGCAALAATVTFRRRRKRCAHR